MTHNGKIARLIVRNTASHQAFARLDAILAINALTDIEKIDRLRRDLFGELPEDGPGDVNELQKSETIPAKADQARPLK